MARTIIHVDLDAFYCAIEEQRDPSLRGRAFAVGGQPGERGVVASCSYPARRLGVRSAMSMAQALARCPQLVIAPSRHAAYRAASAQVMDLLRSVTPLLEQLSIDEAFLDVSALTGIADPAELAHQLQNRVLVELGLSCSLGVATNKLLAKIATDYGKAEAAGQPKPDQYSPHAICVVPPGCEAEFLSPLPVTALWGVGPKTAASLEGLGITMMGDLACWPQQDLMRLFGQHGYDLSQHARGIDKRPIMTEREAKSVSSETTFVQDVTEWDQLAQTLAELVDDVAGVLHRRHLRGTTVKLKLRWSDFTTPTRQLTVPAPTADKAVIFSLCDQLLRQLWTDGRAVRLMGVGVTGLQAVQQLTLWDGEEWVRYETP